MNGYALVAFATPLAALALGGLAVALHRYSLRRRLTPEERARREAQEEQDLHEKLTTLRARLDESARESALLARETALLRTKLDHIDRKWSEDEAAPDAGAATAR